MSIPLDTTVRVLMDGETLIEAVKLGTILHLRDVGYSDRLVIRRQLAEVGVSHIVDYVKLREYVVEVVR